MNSITIKLSTGKEIVLTNQEYIDVLRFIDNMQYRVSPYKIDYSYPPVDVWHCDNSHPEVIYG